MGILNFFSKPTPKLTRLPTGTFTVDPLGRLLASTLPHSFSPACLEAISAAILSVFSDGKKAALPLSEIVVRYAGFKITARELRGGAIIFLKPKGPQPFNA